MSVRTARPLLTETLRWVAIDVRDGDELLKPKKERMFARKEYRAARKGKILGFTASNGRQLNALCPSPWSSDAFARSVRRRVGPLFRSCFPERASMRILLGSEPLLHGQGQ